MNIYWIGMAFGAGFGGATTSQGGTAPPAVQETHGVDDQGTAVIPTQLVPRGKGKQAGDLPGQDPRGFTKEECEGWQRALGESDLDLRLALYLELVDRIATDPLVEQVVDEWSLDSNRPDVAWTARLALREARAVKSRSRRSGRIQNHLFAGLGIHVKGSPQSGAPGTPGDESSVDHTGHHGPRTLRLKTGPGGVRVERRDNVDGSQRTIVFEAASLEQLLEQHPGLARDLGAVRLVPDPNSDELGQVFGALGGQVQFSFDALWSGDAGLLRTDILGIQMREEPSGASGPADGEKCVGILVERIVPESIASVIALRRGDRLLELNNVQMGCGEDVSRVIKDRAAEVPLVVKVERDGVVHTFTWKPSIGEGPSPDGPDVPDVPDVVGAGPSADPSGTTEDGK